MFPLILYTMNQQEREYFDLLRRVVRMTDRPAIINELKQNNIPYHSTLPNYELRNKLEQFYRTRRAAQRRNENNRIQPHIIQDDFLDPAVNRYIRRYLFEEPKYVVDVYMYGRNPGNDRVWVYRGPDDGARYTTRLSQNEAEYIQNNLRQRFQIGSVEEQRLVRTIDNAEFRADYDHFASQLVELSVSAITPYNNAIGDFHPEDVVRFLHNDEFIHNLYIDYQFDSISKQFMINHKTEYIQNNFRPNACIFTLAIDNYYHAFLKHYKIQLTYETLYHLVHKQDPKPDSSYGISYKDFDIKFLTPYCPTTSNPYCHT